MRFSTWPVAFMLTAVGHSAIAGDDPIERAFDRWAAAQKDVSLLVVEFDCERQDGARTERSKGTFAWRRAAGEITTIYRELPERVPKTPPFEHIGMLAKGQVYLLDPADRIAMRFTAAEPDPAGFIERNFVPLAILLDRTRANAECRLEVTAKDEWYSHVEIRPKKPKKDASFPGRYTLGEVVLMNNATKAMPEGAIRRLWFTDGESSCMLDIRAWRTNPADVPVAEDFRAPEDRPGWRVGEWPIRSRKP
jgi:hypothetical protein